MLPPRAAGFAFVLAARFASSPRAFRRATFSSLRGMSTSGRPSPSREVGSSSSEVEVALPWSPLPYQGALVDLCATPLPAAVASALGGGAAPAFAAALAARLDEWSALGVKSAWLRVPIAQAGLIAAAAPHGFVFHHAQGASARGPVQLDMTVTRSG